MEQQGQQENTNSLASKGSPPQFHPGEVSICSQSSAPFPLLPCSEGYFSNISLSIHIL